jgi:hypothetical protein
MRYTAWAQREGKKKSVTHPENSRVIGHHRRGLRFCGSRGFNLEVFYISGTEYDEA